MLTSPDVDKRMQRLIGGCRACHCSLPEDWLEEIAATRDHEEREAEGEDADDDLAGEHCQKVGFQTGAGTT
jgi:hypothetical protein